MSPIVSLSRECQGRWGNNKIANGLGFPRHMKTRLKYKDQNIVIIILALMFASHVKTPNNLTQAQAKSSDFDIILKEFYDQNKG